MRRLLVWLFWRHRTPGPWADRLYLLIVGAAIVLVYVRVVLLLLGVWPLNLPFGIDDWAPSWPGGGDTPAVVTDDAPGAPPAASPSARTSATPSRSPTPSRSATPSRSPSASPTPAPSRAPSASPAATDERAADVRFTLPASYDEPVVKTTDDGTLWTSSDNACELWLVADRHGSGAGDGPDLWQQTVAALFDEERLPATTVAGRLPNAHVRFVTSATQAGLVIEGTDPETGRGYGDQRAALVCGTTLFEVAGRLSGGRPADVRRDVRSVCRSYEVVGAEGRRLILHRTWLPEQGLRLTTPATFAVKPFGGEPFAPEGPNRMARTIVELTPLEETGARGWLEVVPAKAGGVPPTGRTASDITAFLKGAETTVRLGFDDALDWGAYAGAERGGVVRADATFMFSRDGLTWRGRVWWWYADGRRTALALAAPASTFAWQQYVFAAIADSLQGAER